MYYNERDVLMGQQCPKHLLEWDKIKKEKIKRLEDAGLIEKET